MNDDTLNLITVARNEEALRQQRETFDQQKRQDNYWFLLRLSMGFTSIPILIGIAIFAIYILINNQFYPSNVTIAAGTALFADILGLMTGVWKIVLSPSSVTRLQPVTTIVSPKIHSPTNISKGKSSSSVEIPNRETDIQTGSISAEIAETKPEI